MRVLFISIGQAQNLIVNGIQSLFEVMGQYKVPAIDLTPEELLQELTKDLKPYQRL